MLAVAEPAGWRAVSEGDTLRWSAKGKNRAKASSKMVVGSTKK